ncbi:hypothetical protein [Lentilactobacillus senioris]|uniref:hypothetical protein n=1 Tax=Lentilactobacillus senioris TaxID=931534 RepID=UPI003D2D28AD
MIFLKKENAKQFLADFDLDGFYCIHASSSTSIPSGTERFDGEYRKLCDDYPQLPGPFQTIIDYLTDLGFTYTITARVNPEWKILNDNFSSYSEKDSFLFHVPKKIIVELRIFKEYKS